MHPCNPPEKSLVTSHLSFDRILSKRIVPVVALDDAESALPLAEALLQGGLDVIEITFRTAAAEESIRRVVSRYPQMMVGAGTLLQPDQVRKASDAGAVFGLAPGLNENVVRTATEVGLMFAPGVMTPSELERALELNCRLLKFFPAESAGAIKMLKALSGPYGHTGVRFIPTGGITEQNLTKYLNLSMVAAVGASWLVEKHLLEEKNWSEISRRTRVAVELASQPDIQIAQ